MGGTVCMKALNHINLLAYQNTAEIRAKMKTHGLFEVRDNLILHLLRGISEQNTIHFIQNFSFHSIANQPKFRENNGICYLLQLFNKSKANSSSSKQLLLSIYQILHHILSPIEDNKSIILNILKNPLVRLPLPFPLPFPFSLSPFPFPSPYPSPYPSPFPFPFPFPFSLPLPLFPFPYYGKYILPCHSSFSLYIYPFPLSLFASPSFFPLPFPSPLSPSPFPPLPVVLSGMLVLEGFLISRYILNY